MHYIEKIKQLSLFLFLVSIMLISFNSATYGQEKLQDPKLLEPLFPE